VFERKRREERRHTQETYTGEREIKKKLKNLKK
jgi:hypothetical protein